MTDHKTIHIHTTPDDWSDAPAQHSSVFEYVSAKPASPTPEPSVETRVRGFLGRAVNIVAGTALVAIGIPMLIFPGPGLLTLAAGGALLMAGLAPSMEARICRQ